MTPLTPRQIKQIRAAVAEIDPRVVEIERGMTIAQHARRMWSIIEFGRRAMVSRKLKEKPWLSQMEAQREALREYYAFEERMNERLRQR